MRLKSYLKDKWWLFVLFFFMYMIILLMFLAFKVNFSCCLATSILLFLFLIIIIMINFFRKRKFYTTLVNHITMLDKSYLVLETLEKPNFYEGKLLYQILYDINKSMIENVKNYELQMTDFKEYVEMWIHEVKIPIASFMLIFHNHQDKFDKKAVLQMHRLENYVEQILYYVRSENAEKDYLINEVSLSKVISHIALKNKDDLLENNIDFIVNDVNYKVLTDSKWLEFIINQIVNNSIKYKKENGNSYIKITAMDKKDQIILTIEDNGIGIPLADLPKVFQKSFTGHNGRFKNQSTGMGLFIVKNLCDKLGHKINIESKEGSYTRVFLTFSKDQYYEVLR